jgi:hypothetical protein
MRRPARHVAELTHIEWNALMNDFADLVLAKHGVAGSVADYSLYRALDTEREHARGQRARQRRLDRAEREGVSSC